MSAHGIFKAMGGKPRTFKTINDKGEIVELPYRPRQESDFEPTPPEPTRSFINAELAYILDYDLIIEPCAGDGRMAFDLGDCTHLPVFMSDLVDRGAGARIFDFYNMILRPRNSCLITNPPFDQLHGDAPLLRHAFETLRFPYVALLLPWNWLGNKQKAQLWLDHPPSRVYLMRWRIDWTGQGSNPALNAWYVWDRRHHPEKMILDMIDKRDDPRQGYLL